MANELTNAHGTSVGRKGTRLVSILYLLGLTNSESCIMEFGEGMTAVGSSNGISGR